MVKRTYRVIGIYILGLGIGLTGCMPATEESAVAVDSLSGPAIYVASGVAYAGNGVTTLAPSLLVTRFSLSGEFQKIIRDYSSNPGDSPVGISEFDDTRIAVLVENTAGRRIELVKKDGTGYDVYVVNATALSAVVRDIINSHDGGLLVSKSSAIEKFNADGTRIPIGVNPFVSAPAGTCATSTTLLSKIALGPSNHIVMLHAAASPNNQINLVNSAGYLTAGDCISSIDGPSVNHFPTGVVYDSGSGKLLVSYSNNTGAIHQIYAYNITSSLISGATVAYSNSTVVQGISAMAQGSDGTVYVASAASSFNTIERFSLSSGVLTRVGNSPLIGPGVFTRSVTSILVDD